MIEAFNCKNKICKQRDVFPVKKTLTSYLSALELHPPPSVDKSYKLRVCVLIALEINTKQPSAAVVQDVYTVNNATTPQFVTKLPKKTKRPENEGSAMTATQQCKKVCHPIVVVKVNSVICCALLDTGAAVSYASDIFWID